MTVMIDSRQLNNDGIPIRMDGNLKDAFEHGAGSFPTEYTMALANGKSGMGSHRASRIGHAMGTKRAELGHLWSLEEERAVLNYVGSNIQARNPTLASASYIWSMNPTMECERTTTSTVSPPGPPLTHLARQV